MMITSTETLISEIVDESFIFRSLDDNIRARLKAEAQMRSFAPGSVIIREGDEGEEMMIVTRGKVQVSQRTLQGNVPLAQLGRKAVIGEVSVITGTPRTSTVVAIDNVSVVCLPASSMQAILDTSPKMKALLLKLIESRAMQSASKTA